MALTKNEANTEGPPTLKVIIRQPAGKYNRYEWDEKEQVIALAERVWQVEQRQFEIATVPGTISQRGVELGVLIPCDQSDAPGVVVTVRVIGLISLVAGENSPAQQFVVAVPPADPLFVRAAKITDLLPSWKAEVEKFLTLSLQTTNGKVENSNDTLIDKSQLLPEITWQAEKEAWEIINVARKAYRQAQANSRGSGQTGHNWQLSEEELDDYLQGSLLKEDETARHSHAENQLFQLPYRFQQHVASCLLPKERVIAWIFRPAFKKGWLWKRQEENDGLLILTDRQLLWLTDTLPPGSTLTDWGYRVTSFPLNKITGVNLLGLTDKADILKEDYQVQISDKLNPNGPGELQLEVTISEVTAFNFDFQSKKPEVKSTVYRELVEIALTLKEFVPDPTKRKLLKLFPIEPSFFDNFEGNELIKDAASKKKALRLAHKQIEPELPTSLQNWLVVSGRKLLMPPAFTDFYRSSPGDGREPDFIALVIPTSQETEKSDKRNKDCVGSTSLRNEVEEINSIFVFSDLSKIALENTQWLKRAEIVLSKGDTTNLTGSDQNRGVLAIPINTITAVEFVYSVLGCYIQLTSNPSSSKSYLAYGKVYQSPSEHQNEVGEVKFFFFSPEVKPFQNHYLVLRQLMDICLGDID